MPQYPNPSNADQARAHAAEAERILAEAHELMNKRGRQLGDKQERELTLANTHATLAVYYATCAR